MNKKRYFTTTPEVYELCDLCVQNSSIAQDLYKTHNVNRGLRDINGKGVLTGLTEISTILATREENGEIVPDKGRLYYRGIKINDLTQGFLNGGYFGFEETIYLLLLGRLPNQQELESFRKLLADYRKLPTHFTRDVIMKASGSDIMNSMARSVLTLASYDKSANDTSLPNVLRQCLQLISNFSCLAVYAYQAYMHYEKNKGLFIHRPDPKLSIAENILRMLRPDTKFTALEAKILDLSLVLHAEHGGGNNSTFTTHVVTSSGTDTYSSVAASLCSLKGPKHGGANIRVKHMFDDIKKNVKDWTDEKELEAYLAKILNKEAFDRSGLIYGMGHAVYSLSDPRAEIFKETVKMLSDEKGMQKEYELYKAVARISTKLICEKRRIYKGVSPNVDFYSGFAYSLLQIPEEMFTPLFAIARIAGWSAHRLEELINGNKIIRPAYMSVKDETEYLPIDKR